MCVYVCEQEYIHLYTEKQCIHVCVSFTHLQRGKNYIYLKMFLKHVTINSLSRGEYLPIARAAEGSI